jgi:hypothetical protein
MTDTHQAAASTGGSKASAAEPGTDKTERAGGPEAAVSGAGAGASTGGDPGARGRATVPAASDGAGSPKFVRAPGMVPPPDSLTVPVQSQTTAKGSASVSAPPAGPPIGGVPVTSGNPMNRTPPEAPTSAPGAGMPAVARASVRVPGNIGSSPTGSIGIMGGYGSTSGSDDAANSTGSARVSEAVRAARKTVTAAVGRGPRRARLHVKRIDPWSVMKFSFAVSFVLFVVVIVATSVLYLALDAMGVFDSVNKTLSDMIGATGSDSGGGAFKVTAKGVIGGAALLGLVNVVLFTALATLGAFIYNVCADLVGGIELTLAEKE